MSFIDGLKNLFKKPILAIIVILFIIGWAFILVGLTFFPLGSLDDFILGLVGILVGFTLVLCIFSLFVKIEEMKIYLIIIAAVITIPFLFIFRDFILNYFYVFCLIVNQLLTAFFAFRLCMNYSTKLDDWLYTKKESRKYTRVIEFIGFGAITWWLLRIAMLFWQLMNVVIFYIFLVLLVINIILMFFVVIRYLFTKKFSAYITLFFILIFFYMSYFIIDMLAGVIFADPSDIARTSFAIDLALFFYIIGSMYEKIDYIHDKFKYFKVDTVALFIIIMKLIVQVTKLPNVTIILAPLLQEIGVLIIFIAFTLLFGIGYIWVHKEGKKLK